MKTRRNLFSGCAAFLMLLLCVLLVVQVGTPPDDDVEYKGAYQAGQGAGAFLLACIFLPMIFLFALLGWRNDAGIKTNARHNEHMNLLRKELADDRKSI